jgi:hypothetical protein
MSLLTLKKDYPAGYPNDALEVLKAMSFSNGKNVEVVGSMSLRSQIYAGDFDAFEKVETRGSFPIAIRNLVIKFKSIIRAVRKIPFTYIADIKSGSVEEWRIIGDSYNYETSKATLNRLYDDDIITSEQHSSGIRKIKKRVSKLELLNLRDEFRPNVIRWKPSEVLQGYKHLKDGRKFTLEEAFTTPIITKLDVVSWVQNNRFTDFSIIFEFKYNGKVLNPGMGDFETSIQNNIFKLYSEKNYFKMAKRLFSFARFKKNDRVMNLLSPMFNGDLGRLYMVYGDIGTLESMYDVIGILPHEKLLLEIDQFKARLSNISLPAYMNIENDIFDQIERISKTIHYKEKSLKLLIELKDDLSSILSRYSKEYLIEHNLFPSYR